MTRQEIIKLGYEPGWEHPCEGNGSGDWSVEDLGEFLSTRIDFDTWTSLPGTNQERKAAFLIKKWDAKVAELGKSEGKSLRYNKGKLPWRMLELAYLYPIVQGLEAGALKYEENNYKIDGHSFVETLDSMHRHLNAYALGEDIDPDTGVHHLGLAGCNLYFLLRNIVEHPEKDDRDKHPESLKKILEAFPDFKREELIKKYKNAN